MKNNSIIFREDLLFLIKKTAAESVECLSLSEYSTSSSLSSHLITSKILSWLISTADDNLFHVCSVKAALYTVLTHQKKVQIFAMSMKNIDKQLTLDWKCCAEKISIK